MSNFVIKFNFEILEYYFEYLKSLKLDKINFTKWDFDFASEVILSWKGNIHIQAHIHILIKQ